mmetsp:Transcript_38777/g.77240  ORF Transcript_38777/g.77240 Transcript_38777/m.77240 type:complete len:276 (-) Transcript_38777:179-1006(-)
MPCHGLPGRHEFPGKAAPCRIDQEEHVLVRLQDDFLERLPDDDDRVSLHRLWQRLGLCELVAHPMIQRLHRLLARIRVGGVLVALALLEPPDDGVGTFLEAYSNCVHVLRSHDLEDLVHRRSLWDLCEQYAIGTLHCLLLRRGWLDRVAVQREDEVQNGLRLAQRTVVLRRLAMAEPHQLREGPIRGILRREQRVRLDTDLSERDIASVGLGLPHCVLQLDLMVGPLRVRRIIKVNENLLVLLNEIVERGLRQLLGAHADPRSGGARAVSQRRQH